MNNWRLPVFVCLLALASGAGHTPALQGGKADTKPQEVTAILGAFEVEVAMLEDQLADKRQWRIEGMKFSAGKFKGRQAVIAWTGVGKVNAAMTTTLLIEHFRPREVIFTGIAGAVNAELEPGDIVIAQKTAHHDSGVLRDDGLQYRGARNPMDGWRNPVFFEADQRLLAAARQASKKVKFETINTTTGERAPHVLEGVVVTGDVFVASPKKCLQLRQELNADAVEMEGAAVAQICYQQVTPCIVIRSISDSADEGAIQDTQMFYIMAARNSSSLVGEIVALLQSQGTVQKNQQGK